MASIAPERILLLDAYFTVVIFHGTTIAQWRKANYQAGEGWDGGCVGGDGGACDRCNVDARAWTTPSPSSFSFHSTPSLPVTSPEPQHASFEHLSLSHHPPLSTLTTSPLSLSLSHHHLSLSPPDPQHASFAHLSHIPISHHPPPSPPLHLTYQLHTLTPLTSSLLSPSTDPQHASFAQLLEAPRIDARAIIRARFPSPRLVDCDQNGSQSRFLLAKLNPSATYSNIAGATGEVIMVRAWVGSSDVRR